jgi:Ca-activated chloride channel family protein
MTFGSPIWLWAFLAVPAVVGIYVRSRRRRGRLTAGLAAQGLVAGGQGRASRRRYLPFVFFVLALALLVLAIARPMATIKAPRQQATVILAMDVSNSMAATDVAPNRISVAKSAASAFVRAQPSSVKIGVVAFGSSSVIVQPPTFDHGAVLRSIGDLSLGGGTSLAAGILTALDALAGKKLTVNLAKLDQDNSNDINIGYFGGATIVLFSDGEDTSSNDPVTMARLASTAGVRIQTVGIGTVAGTDVKIGSFEVETAMDPQTLENVAKVSNGAYHPATSYSGLAALARSINLHFTVVTEHTQISALFTAAAVLLLVVGAFLSVLWFGRVM